MIKLRKENSRKETNKHSKAQGKEGTDDKRG
jgi:hypothetical protein